LGLHDRGAIDQGLRADLARVRLVDQQPAVRAVWCGGVRVS
jgi:alpha-D-ribose 1-methylphosphonate 5-triphosphate diphosphatase